MNIDENMFHKETIFLNIEAKTSDEALDYVYQRVYALGWVSEAFQAAVKEREHKYPTGLPGPVCAIAVPHTDPEYVKKPFIAVATAQAGIPFIQMATKDVALQAKVIFVLGFKTGKYQVKILQTLIRLFIQEGKMAKRFLKLKETDVEQCYEMLEQIQQEVVQGE